MSQTTYSTNLSSPLSGQLDSMEFDARTYVNPADVLEYGFGVAKDSSADNACKALDGAGNDFLGIAVRNMPSVEENYPALSAVSVLHDGAIWVAIDQTVTANDPVYVRHTGTAADIGKFRKDADTANALLVDEARWLIGGTSGGVALLSLKKK